MEIPYFDAWTITVGLVVLVILLLFLNEMRLFRLFASHGIPAPTPIPFLGNIHSLMRMGGLDKVEEEWCPKYGKVFGLLFGRLPFVTISDMDILKEILVKDFSHFPNHAGIDSMNPNPVDKGVFFQKGAAWKRIRSIVTPTFSSGKLKMMVGDIKRCAETLSNSIQESARSGKSLDVKDCFGAYTMDVIASTAFGIQVDSQSNPDDPFVKMAKGIFDIDGTRNPAFLFVALCPALAPIFAALGITYWKKDTIKFFCEIASKLIEERKETNTDRVDFLQLMMQAELTEEEGTTSGTSTPTNKRLSTDEILGQAFLFFTAGYETTATLLQFVAYELVVHPEIQDKVVQEIQAVMQGEEPTYETVSKLVYMEQVLNETLRRYPPLARISRVLEFPREVCGYTLPECAIIIPVFRIHHDPEIYPDPEAFKPERFAPELKSERNPLAFLPFGAGPRLCIGMRLALMEAKMALACTLAKVKFVACSDMEVPLKVSMANVTKPLNPIRIQVEPRQQLA